MGNHPREWKDVARILQAGMADDVQGTGSWPALQAMEAVGKLQDGGEVPALQVSKVPILDLHFGSGLKVHHALVATGRCIHKDLIVGPAALLIRRLDLMAGKLSDHNAITIAQWQNVSPIIRSPREHNNIRLFRAVPCRDATRAC